MTTPLDRLAATSRSDGYGSGGFIGGYFNRLADLLGRIDVNAVAEMVSLFNGARVRGSRIYFIGNGGKAAICSEFAQDLGLETGGKFRCISLTDNSAAITAIGNDHGFERIFIDQLDPLLVPGDIVVALTASGASPNVLLACEFARRNGALVVALTGEDGGKLRGKTDVEVNVPSEADECGLVEDCHMAIMHSAVNWLMRAGAWRV